MKLKDSYPSRQTDRALGRAYRIGCLCVATGNVRDLRQSGLSNGRVTRHNLHAGRGFNVLSHKRPHRHELRSQPAIGSLEVTTRLVSPREPVPLTATPSSSQVYPDPAQRRPSSSDQAATPIAPAKFQLCSGRCGVGRRVKPSTLQVTILYKPLPNVDVSDRRREHSDPNDGSNKGDAHEYLRKYMRA